MCTVPQLSVSIGIYGVKYILEYGGYGYFPNSMISKYIESGELHVLEDAPQITQPIYLAHCRDARDQYTASLLAGFREIATKI